MMLINSGPNASDSDATHTGQDIQMQDMPLGFSFTLATNQEALTNFANMTDDEKRQVLEAARNVQTKSEMQSFVESIGDLSYRNRMY